MEWGVVKMKEGGAEQRRLLLWPMKLA